MAFATYDFLRQFVRPAKVFRRTLKLISITMGQSKRVILLDVDGTLMDDERVIHELRHYLRRTVGAKGETHYTTILERLCARLGYAENLGAFQRYRLEHPCDAHMLRVPCFLIEYPFRSILKPGVLHTIRKCCRLGLLVVLSDGDAVFQPHKIMASGIWKAVRGRVLIFAHKEKMLHEVERLYPARHYVMVDDKVEILRAMKKAWKSRLTTILVGKGQLASGKLRRQLPTVPDISIANIGDLPQALHV